LLEILKTFAERISVQLLDSGEDGSDDGRNDVEDPDSDRKPGKDPERESGFLARFERRGHDQDGAGFQGESQADLKMFQNIDF
jgi:hypothetical protein